MASYEAILAKKYPAKAHARKVVSYLKQEKPDLEGVLYLEGAHGKLLEDSDSEAPFRQDIPIRSSDKPRY